MPIPYLSKSCYRTAIDTTQYGSIAQGDVNALRYVREERRQGTTCCLHIIDNIWRSKDTSLAIILHGEEFTGAGKIVQHPALTVPTLTSSCLQSIIRATLTDIVRGKH